MRCPRCHADDTKVVDSREVNDGGAIRRRRACVNCQSRFTTYERMEEAPLFVIKVSGSRQPFERAKIVVGVAAACKGRPVSEAEIEQLAEELEDEARVHGPEITSAALGLAVLERLRALDEVAYLRFASVYKGFDDPSDFEREAGLLAHRPPDPSA